MTDQIKAYELKRLHIAANAGDLPEDSTQDLYSDILDLQEALESCNVKLKRERTISKKLRAEVKSLKESVSHL